MDGTDVMGEANVRGAVWLPKPRTSSTDARVGWSKPILSRIAHKHDLEQQASELILQGHDNAAHNLRSRPPRKRRAGTPLAVGRGQCGSKEAPEQAA